VRISRHIALSVWQASFLEGHVVNIDRIYTRSGDQGQTGLGDGQRVSKRHPRIIAGGSVDETNCAIGVALAATLPGEVAEILRNLQQFLFDLGADLCVPMPIHGVDPLPSRISQKHIDQLEQLIDRFNEPLEPLRSFVLPGGHPAAAALHLARSICRRAEVDALTLHETEPLNPALLICLNRLSDLLFVLARAANDNGRTDVLWQPGKGLTAK
jgi:cob(I)alamin adenosyltransferase